MTKRKLFLVFGLFLVLSWTKTIQAQSTSVIGIALNEYCVSNIGLSGIPQTDYYGNKSDWLELKSNFTSAVNMGSYYLSDDRLNLYKWQFPANYIIAPGQHKIIWLSGKNTTTPNGEVHTNFTLDQCKNEWLILSNSQGVVRDSVLVQRTKEGDSWSRVDYSAIGMAAWKVYHGNTFGLLNGGTGYINYAPKPIIRAALASANTSSANTGGFYTGQTGQLVYISQEPGVPFDSSTTCFRIFYTLDNGNYPVPGAVGTVELLDSLPVTTSQAATLIRAICVPFFTNIPGSPSGCETSYLPSFCETNTYFTDPLYGGFSPQFGVVSIAMDAADTSWFHSSGSAKPIVHVEYFDGQKQVSEGYTQLDRPVNEAWLTAQRGFNMTIDDRRGFGCNFEGNIFNVDSLGASDRKIFPTLELKAGDYESHSQSNGGTVTLGTGILDVFYQSLAAKNNLHVSPLHIKPVITFINGQYQGVNDMREVYDKYYENYYNHQSLDSLDLLYYHGTDGSVSYYDGLPSSFSTGPNTFVNSVYTLAVSPTINAPLNYNKLFSRLDKESFIDYMILNSYAMNENLWKYNIAFAKGGQSSEPGSKWHYYLWNMPAIFNFTSLGLPGANYFPNTTVSPCFVHTGTTAITPPAGNGHGNMLANLMATSPPPTAGSGRYMFQQDYKNRYQDLLNGPLKCENILKHYDYVKNLFLKEMTYMGDPTSAPVAGGTQPKPYQQAYQGDWDTNTVICRRGIAARCEVMSQSFNAVGCYGLKGPYPLTVDVQPVGAGTVILNTLALDHYIWSGSYYATTISFKAVPKDNSYSFSHWEFKNHTPLNSAPLSLDSVAIGYAQPGDDVVAVFTDKKNDISMPTGFTPNGDGINDMFLPMGSALFSTEFDMTVWNRWGQQVYRSTDPTQGWDGNYKGQQSQTGVYAYVITYKNAFNESKTLKGNLTLLR